MNWLIDHKFKITFSILLVLLFFKFKKQVQPASEIDTTRPAPVAQGGKNTATDTTGQQDSTPSSTTPSSITGAISNLAIRSNSVAVAAPVPVAPQTRLKPRAVAR
jgi:hypothetical protein